MKIFTTTTFLALGVLLVGWAYAQEQPDMPMMQMGEGMSDQMMNRCRMTMGAELSPRDPAVLLGMKDQLDLTDQQAEQLQALADQTRQQAAAILTDAQRQEVEQLPQQPQSMRQMHQQMMGRMQGRDGGMGQMQGKGNMDMCAMMMRMMGGMHKGGEAGKMMCPMCGMQMKQDTEAPATQPAEQVELDAEAQAQVDRLVSSYLTIQQRLAEDQITGVTAQLDEIHGIAHQLAKTDTPKLQESAEAVATAAHDAQPKDLEQARAKFKSLSTAVIGLMQIAPPTDRAASSLYVATCPMAEADWVQTSKLIVNPYMGQRMLRCGSVKQTAKAPLAEAQE